LQTAILHSPLLFYLLHLRWLQQTICGSTEIQILVFQKSSTVFNTKDLAAFSAVIWNSLPAALRVMSMLAATYGRYLEAYLLSCLQLQI